MFRAVFLAVVVASCGASGGRPEDNLLAGKTPDVMTFTRHAERMTDGVAAVPGTRWDGRLASVIQSGGSVEWDLGRVRPIARAFIQADHNDGYAFIVSRDRKRWTTVWEAPPVEAAGLRSRATDSIDANARYLRLEPRGGDGKYAVAEIVVSGSREGPWPPPLAEAGGDDPDPPGRPPLGTPLSIAAGLAVVVLLTVRVAGSRGGPLPWLSGIAGSLSIFVVVTALGYTAQHRFNLVDDAYISLQYAKNWISGQGLVFNPGERVEGYTNFLWVSLLAPLWPLSGHNPALMARAASWLSLGFGVVGLLLVALIARRVFAGALLPAVFALLLVAYDDAYVSYTVVFALENHLLVVLVLTGLGLVVYRPRHWELALGVSFALVGMTRPDGLLWPVAFLAAYAPLGGRRRALDAQGVSAASLARVGLGFAGLFGAYFFWRVCYFGDPLPNTFYLKVGATLGGLGRGLAYLRSYASQRFWIPVAALASVLLTRAAWARWLLIHVGLHAAYVLYVGGDFYAGHRFLLVLAPGLALLAGVVLRRATEALRNRWLGELAPGVVLLSCLAVRWGTLREGPYSADVFGDQGIVADNNVKYMQWLKDVARPQASMVVGDIGATGLFADVRVLDVFGVVDRDVAHKHVSTFGAGKPGHEKLLSREEQLARGPTYIKWGYVDDARAPPGYYIFNDFPPELRVEGLWVKDDLAQGGTIAPGAWRMRAPELAGWERSGDAFANAPSLCAAKGQGFVNGQKGPFIDTFTDQRGDHATGRMLSPPFPLVGDRIRLLVGGGRDPERLRVSLLVDGQRLFSETGCDWETLGRREWDIAALRGRMARLEIVDEASGAWGHLLVDEVEQWVGTPATAGRL